MEALLTIIAIFLLIFFSPTILSILLAGVIVIFTCMCITISTVAALFVIVWDWVKPKAKGQ